MRDIPERIEKLARAMCEALDLNPDDRVPIACPDRNPNCLVAHVGPRWRRFAWEAKKFVFLESKGELS